MTLSNLAIRENGTRCFEVGTLGRRGRDHRSGLPLRGLGRGTEDAGKIDRERVGEYVLLPGLDALEDRQRHIAGRSLWERKITDHIGVDRTRVDAEDRGALRPKEDTPGLRQRMQR